MKLRQILPFLLVLFFCVPSLRGQSFKELKTDLSLAGSKGTVFSEIRSGNISDAGKKFFTGYYFARWTVRSNSKDVHKFRAELIADAEALPDAGKKVFIPAATKFLSLYARSNEYYPACRYNAILAIGEFNESKNANNIPVPYAGVLKGLCALADSNSLPLPDYVRLGALIGLVRHAELGIKDPEQKNTVINIFLSILTAKYAEEKSLRPELHTWFELKAIEGLGKFKTPKGPNGPAEIIDALKVIIDNTKADSEVRSLAARTIGAMNLSELKQYNYVELLKSLVQLARNFYTEDIAFIDTENLRDQIKKGGAAMGMGGMDGGMGAMGGMSAMGPDPAAMGMGGMDAMGGMGGMGAGAMSADEAAKVNKVISRVKFDFGSINDALVGINGKAGISPMIGKDQKDAIEMLNKTLEEIKNQNNFLDFGRDADGEIATKSQRVPVKIPGVKKSDTSLPAVTVVEIKDFLNEQLIHFNDIIGNN